MAVLGFQLCFSLIMASFLQKLIPIYSLGRWLMCNGSLLRYKHPNDEELKKLAGKPSEKSNGKSRHRRNNYKVQMEESKTFKVPRNIDISLDAQPIAVIDTVVLRNYSDYEWLVNYTLISVLVYIGTEIYYEVLNPTKEFNVSIVWIFLSMYFALQNLFVVLRLYARTKAGGEISMSVAFGMFSFVIALGILIVKEDILEFGLEEYTSQNATNLHGAVLGQTHLSLSKVKLFLAGCSGVLGIALAFPAIRMAQMYVDALKFSSGNLLLSLLLHINFFAPAVITLMWVKPMVRDLIRDPNFGRSDETSPLLTDSQFEITRIVFVIVVCFLRLALIRTHLQAYLNIAYDKILKLKKESGLITNVELQKMVSQVFYYLGIVAVQYLSPLVLLLCSVLCLKTMGSYSWLAFQADYVDEVKNTMNSVGAPASPLDSDATFREMVQSVSENVFSLKAVFTPILLRGVFSYFVWWIAMNWFIASCLGLLYHSYLVI